MYYSIEFELGWKNSGRLSGVTAKPLIKKCLNSLKSICREGQRIYDPNNNIYL